MCIIGGDFGDCEKPIVQTALTTGQLTSVMIPTALFGKPHTIKPSDLSSVDIVTDENNATLLGACGRGIVGTLIAGPIGAVVGGLLGGRRNVQTALITLADQRRFLATCPPNEYRQLPAAVMAPGRKVEKRDWSFLDQ